MYTNTLLDFSEYESPVKTYIDEPISLQLDPTQEALVTMLVQPASSDLYDNYLEIWSQKSQDFFTIDTVRTSSQNMDPTTNVLATVNVRLDTKSVVYGRVSESLLKALEAMGGFLESMMLIGTVLVIFFQKRLFKGAFIK